MKEVLTKLLSVKSLVTLAMTGALVFLLFSERTPAKELLALFCTSYGAVISFFFTKRENDGEM